MRLLFFICWNLHSFHKTTHHNHMSYILFIGYMGCGNSSETRLKGFWGVPFNTLPSLLLDQVSCLLLLEKKWLPILLLIHPIMYLLKTSIQRWLLFLFVLDFFMLKVETLTPLIASMEMDESGLIFLQIGLLLVSSYS